MTVHSIGFGWWQRLVERCDWRIFRRVTKVALDGPRYTSELLPHLARLSDLRELDLENTSIDSSAVEAWKRHHPHVVVTAGQRGLTRSSTD